MIFKKIPSNKNNLIKHEKYLRKNVFFTKDKWPHFNLLFSDVKTLSKKMPSNSKVLFIERTNLYGDVSLLAPFFNRQYVASIDCSENLTFQVGDKLVVTGTVELKSSTSLDQSSTITSGQTQQGSSYSTNYAHAINNYVEVSIPYPRTLVVTNDAAWKTTPEEGENYTGGGGSGEGGSYYKDKDGNTIRPDTHCETSAAGDCSPTKRSDRLGEGSYDGTAVLQKQKILLTDMNYKAYPDDEGNFATIFELRAGVFNQGTYAVKVNYFGYNE